MFKINGKLGVRPDAKGRQKVLSNYVAQARQQAGSFRGRKETAMYNPGLFGGGMRNSLSMSATGNASQRVDTYLMGIMPEQEEFLRKFYRDIYYYDTVAGSAVDLMSTLPFSDWTLSGADDKYIDKFNSSIERLNLKTMFPEISVDYLVMGAFIGTLVFKNQEKIFTDIIPHDLEDCEIQNLPFYGMDPLIEVRSSDTIRNFLKSQDPRIEQLRRRVSGNLLSAMNSDKYTLDPLTTLFLPRKTFTTSKCTSFFRRIIPIYMLEKILFRGTLMEAGKRQRSTLHIQAGDDEWEPTGEELNAIVALFQQADLDPLGAIIATRQSVSPTEIRQGGDFWKWTDVVDQTTAMKLRALGINESFLSGDANYNTMEMALSVFIENLRAYRDMVTLKVFTQKLFPLIAVANGFYKSDKKKEEARARLNPYLGDRRMVLSSTPEYLSKMDIQYEIDDPSKLIIPQVQWHKALRPEADRDYMDVLQSLSDKGIPIPLRLWAAAGGLTMENIIHDLHDEKQLRQQLEKLKTEADMGGADTGMGDTNDTSYNGEEDPSKQYEESSRFRNTMGGIKRIGFLHRDFGDASLVAGSTKTGKKKHIINQRGAQERVNREMSKALHNMSDRNRYEQITGRLRRAGALPNLYGGSK